MNPRCSVIPLLYKRKFRKSVATHVAEECQPPLLLQKVSQYTSNLYCNTPPICIAVLLVPLRFEGREILSVLLPFVSQYTSHLYCNTPPICIVVLLEKIVVVVVTGMFPNVARQGVPAHACNYVSVCLASGRRCSDREEQRLPQGDLVEHLPRSLRGFCRRKFKEQHIRGNRPERF